MGYFSFCGARRKAHCDCRPPLQSRELTLSRPLRELSDFHPYALDFAHL